MAERSNCNAAAKTSMVADLELLDEWIPERMEPGMMFLLEQASDGPSGQNPYWAVLACPQCGALGLITRRQYQGWESMICDGDHCSAEYFVGESAIRYRRPH